MKSDEQSARRQAASPRLVALRGLEAGAVFPLEGPVFAIGRHPDNDLQLRQSAISRRHCRILREGDACVLEDLESHHGTLVNGLPVQQRQLGHGDVLSLGSSRLVFLLWEVGGEAARRPESSVIFEDGAGLAATGTQTAAELSCDEALFLRRRPQVPGSQDPGPRAARDLAALLELSTALQGVRRLDDLARALLEAVTATLPAARSSLLLLDRGGALEAVLTLPEGENAPLKLSRTLADRALTERRVLLAADVALEGAASLEGVASLAGVAPRSVLCAPLATRDAVHGLLYLRGLEDGEFTADDLPLVAGFAGIAALALGGVRHLEQLEEENRRLRQEDLDHEMIGRGPAMRRLYALIARVAPSDATVLIRGESGTGKELVARALHRNSRRSGGPFVAINCATFSENLLESDLFGHEKGAFTGALARKIGKLEIADGGTLFLDEVGEIPLAIQARLLRVLQEREFERVGGNRPLEADVRLVAATNRDLEAAIREGRFREDLFYRLNVIAIPTPPLRERREDLPLLAGHFAEHFSRRLGRRALSVSPQALACLKAYAWPGNVRELANALERAAVLCQGEQILPEDLPEAVLEGMPQSEGEPASGQSARGYHERLNEVKRQLILDAVEEAGGNYAQAADRLGLQRTYLHRLITNLNLRERLRG